MSRKPLKPEDFKIHIDSIYSFLESEKKYSQIRKFNSRFIHIKDTLLERKIILEKIIGNTNFYINNKDYVFSPKDYEYLLKQYQQQTRYSNKKFFDSFGKRVVKKQLKSINNNTNISTNEKLNQLESGLEKFKEQQIEIKKAMDELSQINDNLEKQNKKLLSENIKLKFQLNIETTANGCFKQRIRELERIESFGKIPLQKQNENLTDKIEESKKEILEKEKNIESLKNSLEESGKKIIELTKLNKKYIDEYSAFINEKLAVIEDLKKQLHQQQSEKNQISVIKVLGIPLIKKTTKTIK